VVIWIRGQIGQPPEAHIQGGRRRVRYIALGVDLEGPLPRLGVDHHARIHPGIAVRRSKVIREIPLHRVRLDIVPGCLRLFVRRLAIHRHPAGQALVHTQHIHVGLAIQSVQRLAIELDIRAGAKLAARRDKDRHASPLVDQRQLPNGSAVQVDTRVQQRLVGQPVQPRAVHTQLGHRKGRRRPRSHRLRPWLHLGRSSRPIASAGPDHRQPQRRRQLGPRRCRRLGRRGGLVHLFPRGLRGVDLRLHLRAALVDSLLFLRLMLLNCRIPVDRLWLHPLAIRLADLERAMHARPRSDVHILQIEHLAADLRLEPIVLRL